MKNLNLQVDSSSSYVSDHLLIYRATWLPSFVKLLENFFSDTAHFMCRYNLMGFAKIIFQYFISLFCHASALKNKCLILICSWHDIQAEILLYFNKSASFSAIK